MRTCQGPFCHCCILSKWPVIKEIVPFSQRYCTKAVHVGEEDQVTDEKPFALRERNDIGNCLFGSSETYTRRMQISQKQANVAVQAVPDRLGQSSCKGRNDVIELRQFLP